MEENKGQVEGTEKRGKKKRWRSETREVILFSSSMHEEEEIQRDLLALGTCHI